MTTIIAEAGVNHNGILENAFKLIDIAKDCNVDIIKFQTFKTENVISKNAKKADYQLKTTGEDENQFEMVKKLELSYDDFKKIYERCKEKNIKFMSTPFDLESVDFLDKLGVDCFKVGSGELTNYILLKKIAETGKKIILSTGMSDLEEVENSVSFIKSISNSELVLLHCVSCYPTNINDLNLKSIVTMKEKFNIEIGFSDHTQGFDASIYSVALGATYIEKHFTIDNNMFGPDHKASLNPSDLKDFVNKIRRCEVMLGDGIKKCKDAEKNTRSVARRSLCFNKNLKKGHIVTLKDLSSLRPYNGICVSKYANYLGLMLKEDVKKNDFLNEKHFISNDVWNDIFNDREWGEYPQIELVKFISRKFNEKLKNEENIKVLEIGSGCGANLWFLSEKKIDTYGIEGSEIGIKISYRRLKERNLNATIHLGNFCKHLPFEDNFFDAVIDLEAMTCNNDNDIKNCLNEINRVLKKNGYLYWQIFKNDTHGIENSQKIGKNLYLANEGTLKDKGMCRCLDEEDIEYFLGDLFTIESYNLSKISIDYKKNKWQNEWIIYAKK